MAMWCGSFRTLENRISELYLSENLNDLAEVWHRQGYSKKAHHVIISDRNVAKLYLPVVKQKFVQAGFNVFSLVIESGEQAKSFERLQEICEKVLSFGVSKDSCLIVLGGGVPANIAGLAASLIFRGLHLTLIPTTILAQCDSAIDIKHAVNSTFGKNTIGSLYSPEVVYINTDFAKTLPLREVRCGLAEVAKHALIQSPELFDYLNNITDFSSAEFFARHLPIITKDTISLKMSFLEPRETFPTPDWRDMGPQYGHAFGHAIEHLSEYRINHGEAIAIGMQLSAELAYSRGICSKQCFEQHGLLLKRIGLPTELPDFISIDDLVEQTLRDKLATEQGVLMALPSEIGRCYKQVNSQGGNNTAMLVTRSEIREILSSHCERFCDNARRAA